jgi:hypothetical protein
MEIYKDGEPLKAKKYIVKAMAKKAFAASITR